MNEPDLVRALEERCFNAWPALATALADGWVLRLSDGHTRRANSASALSPSGIAPERIVETVETLFRARGLKPLFRLTCLADPAVERLLAARGWREEEPSFGMVADVDGRFAPYHDVRIETALTEGWIDGAMAAYGKGEVWKITPDRQACVIATGLSQTTAVAMSSAGKGFRAGSLYAAGFDGNIVEVTGAAKAAVPG